MGQALHVVMYHYIRDLPMTRFPRIKGMLLDDFLRQVTVLQDRYEMATLESALDLMRGAYIPKRDLCLLTFDDGLKEHYREVTPILLERHIQGLFFPITSCLEESCLAPVHMNHFLMASLEFDQYQRAFLEKLEELAPGNDDRNRVDPALAMRTYRWDKPEVAGFKYLFNFVLEGTLRDRVVSSLFEKHLGDEREFARSLYLNWEEARQMQSAGMLMGGHSHGHQPLAVLPEDELTSDLTACRRLLWSNLKPQTIWPFSYPYGKRNSFNQAVARQLDGLGFTCAFSTEPGMNAPGTARFALHRLDCKDAPMN